MAVPALADTDHEAAIPAESWLDRWRRRATEWLSQAEVRRRLARFPLTRPIARLYARRLFDLSAGFVYSQVLAAFVEASLPERIGAEARPASELARDTGLAEPALRRLLDAATALGLVHRDRRDRYRLTAMGAALRGNDGLTAMIAHHRMLYRDLADPLAILRGRGSGELAGFWPYSNRADSADLDAEAVASYSGLMTASAPLVIEQIIDSYPLGRHRRLLDVGGGEGAFVEAAVSRHPELRATLFDLPAVVRRATERLAGTAVAARIETVGGDFRHTALPEGADLVTFVRILHDHDDDAVRGLLEAARRALRPGGRVLIAEPFTDTPGGARTGDAYFGFYLLAMGQGRCRRVGQYRRLLEENGFGAVRWWPTAVPLQAGVLTGDLS
jgi:demethylspheroidene O-methyltransferase